MMLHEILRDVIGLLGDIGCDHVTIARAGDHAYQVRFTPDKTCKRGYRIEGRRWMDGTDLVPTRGTEKAYVGWARWSTHLGWHIEAILAEDWRLL